MATMSALAGEGAGPIQVQEADSIFLRLGLKPISFWLNHL